MSRASSRPEGRRAGVRARWVQISVVLSALLFGVSVTPTAGATAVSILTLSANADLPRYPCFLTKEPCKAELVGDVSGPLAGPLPDGSWSVSLLDAGTVGSFVYVNGIDCSTGSAAGSLTVLADSQGLVDGRLLSNDGSSRSVSGLRLHADFTLQQDGAQTVVFLANVTVELNVVEQGWMNVASGLKGTGTTSYLPDLGAVDPFDCSWLLATNPPPARVTIDGTLGLAGA